MLTHTAATFNLSSRHENPASNRTNWRLSIY